MGGSHACCSISWNLLIQARIEDCPVRIPAGFRPLMCWGKLRACWRLERKRLLKIVVTFDVGDAYAEVSWEVVDDLLAVRLG